MTGFTIAPKKLRSLKDSIIRIRTEHWVRNVFKRSFLTFERFRIPINRSRKSFSIAIALPSIAFDRDRAIELIYYGYKFRSRKLSRLIEYLAFKFMKLKIS
ncbi:hypothetical protein CKA32_000743 [Geitlerinema sp. FC II]|nr:hypothetical protein CKA32_000743 [Geitlerinema sp. FC II]